ncbi:thermonuclease family protein [Sphingomonas beigongshangi]|uniref:thermonuclease family protein n=1 Tax=Sphingomonas beigongshangi TaxID=2782540 RepID=UPI001AEE0EA2|nr:thermonuclease family protein [Sphingomonas beigongshangi]
MKRGVSLIALAALTLVSSPAAPQTFDAQGRAIDGDTVAVDFRLLGVDAFERRQLCRNASGCWTCGKAAQDFAAKALRSGAATISLRPSSSYGRPVATVRVAGQDLGERMIRAGLAIPQVQYLRHDPARSRRYATAFTQAKAGRAGAFAGSWLEPSRWRRGERLRCER